MIVLALRPCPRPGGEAGVEDAVVLLADRLGAPPEGRRLDDPEGPWLSHPVPDGVSAVGLVLALLRTGLWDVGVGIGGRADPEVLRAALRRATAGPAAHVAVEPATGTSSGAGSGGVPAAALRSAAESGLVLLGRLEARRTDPQQEAGRLVETGASQREAAAELGITQQAVHDRLRGGLWHEARAHAGAVAGLLDALDGRPGVTG